MQNQSEFQYPICQIHNLQAMNFQEDSQEFLCDVCQQIKLTNKTKKLQEQRKKLLQQFDGQDDQNEKILNQFILKLVDQKSKFEKNIENIIEQANMFKGQQQQSKQQIRTTVYRPAEIISEHEKYINQQNLFQINIQQQLEQIKVDLKFDWLFEDLNQLDSSSLNLPEQPTPDQIQINNQYQEIKNQYTLQKNQSFLKQEDKPFSVSFNKEGTAVAAGCQNSIKIFEFKNKQLNEKFLINNACSDNDSVNFLKFLRTRNHLISVGSDCKIIIWQYENLQQWQKIQILEGHLNFIRCFCINSNEDLMVTGSSDNSIISWRFIDKWINEQKIQCKNTVWSVSLSPSSSKLISAEDKNIITLFEYQNGKWKSIQEINIGYDSIRLCFVGENEFVIQLWKEEKLYFYSLNNENNEFEKSYDVQVNKSNSDEAYFPIIFNQQKNILIIKNCKYLNILSKKQGNIFKVQQSIEFKSFKFYGDVTDDGKYMIIWDYDKKEYQIRQLE